MGFGEFLLYVLWIFYFFALLVVMFIVLTDLFRDKSLSGWWKAVWVIALLFFPFITALVYVIARGKGMRERRVEEQRETQAAQQSYIRSVTANKSPAEQISTAKSLLDSGAISNEEFETLKAKALA